MITTSIQEVFATVDSGDAAAFGALFSEDARLTFGNGKTMVGRKAIEQGVSGFFQTIKALHHFILNEWTIGQDKISELSVTYDRLDGQSVTVPVVSIWRTRGDGLIDDYRVFFDLTPVFS